jgi:hypothetical protein
MLFLYEIEHIGDDPIFYFMSGLDHKHSILHRLFPLPAPTIRPNKAKKNPDGFHNLAKASGRQTG